MDYKAKSYGRDVAKADARSDIALINRYTLREFGPEDVYCFSVVLCDNEVDRDFERFSIGTLEQLAKLFVGKTGIVDHEWSAKNQIARLYRAEVEKVAGQKNALGETLHRLRGSAYMIRNEETQPIIDAIDAGIMKEVSVGVSIAHCNCSLCGKPLIGGECENGHTKGQRSIGGFLCVGSLEDARDAYEFSFVAVPAQRGAGVTKTARKAAKPVAKATEKLDLPPAASVPKSAWSFSSVRYAVINEKHVYDGDRKAAWTALGFARKDMGLPPIRLCWFVPETEAKAKGWDVIGTFEHDSRLGGLFDPTVQKTVFVRYNGSAAEMQKATLHELYHCKQSINGRYMSEEAEEELARKYEAETAKRLWALSKDEQEDLFFCEVALKDWSKA